MNTVGLPFRKVNDLLDRGIKRKSHTPVLWECDLGHEWLQAPSRIKEEANCLYCSGVKILPGFNDLGTLYPEFAAEWHSNNGVNVSTIAPKSNKKYLWICKRGHEWEATVVARTRNNARGCKICSGREILTGFNDLKTIYPDLAQQWHPTKNGTLKPETVGNKSMKKVWWQCKEGHEWKTTVNLRVNQNTGCPVCSGQKLLAGVNDLATVYPEVANIWHPTKNSIKPSEVFPYSTKVVWWLGACGHSWENQVAAQRNTSCRYCSGARVLEGFNDLKTTHPELVTQWHRTRNFLSPTEVSVGSNKAIWWQCEKDHEWEAMPWTRAQGSGCPGCAGQQFLPGVNDLKTTHPSLFSELHPTLNTINLDRLRSGSTTYSVWWQCQKKKDHIWQATVSSRVGPGGRKGTGCPHCASQNLSEEENLLAEWLEKDLGLNIVRRNRKLIYPYEVDIFIPEKNIAIEYNGLYWHTEEQGKHKNYHYNKWVSCKQQGVQLIQIWSDDWQRKPELVKNMLAYKLGVADLTKVPGRKTIITDLTTAEVTHFLEKHHIQGPTKAGIRLGLKDKDTEELFAVMLLKSEPKTNGKVLNLLRYATSAQVQGGFTKLLKYVELVYKPSSIISFSDNTVSDGKLYESNGFVAVKELKPDYMYVVGNRLRSHKFNYRLERFREDPTLQYENGLTEKELATLNNLPRVWDAGKIKWEKSFSY